MKLTEQGETNGSTAVLQIDFAENYSTFWKDEVQSAHWHKNQITVFTAALWQSVDCTLAVVVSDDRSHSRDCAIVFLEHLIKQLLNKNITALHIWSDGPSSQFKNRYIAATSSWLQKECSIKITWHFFASSHGKGPVDWQATEVIKRKAIITDHLLSSKW